MTLRLKLASSAAVISLLQSAGSFNALGQTLPTTSNLQLAQAQPAPGTPAAASAATPAGSPAPGADASANASPAGPAEQIVVTGSRVRRSNLETTSPVVNISAADIQAKGLTNTADVLNQLPEVGAATNVSTSTNFSTDVAGISTINLRNLGDARTLVLIDGRRTAGGVPPGQGGNAVDINTIPAYLIDRVDITTGGGSSAYGSEAVAGVVNFVLRQNFDGLLFNQQLGLTQYGDDRTTTTDLLAGTSFHDGQGHFLIAAEYQDQGEVNSKDRSISQFDLNDDPNSTSAVNTRAIYTPSSFTPTGTFGTQAGRYEVLGNGSAVPYVPSIYGFNRDALRTISIPEQRLSIYTKTNYDITPDLNYFIDARFTREQATTLLEPIAIGGNNVTPIGFGGDFLQVPANNPYIPASLAALGLQTIPDPNNPNQLDLATARRRFLELGPRGDQVTRYNYGVTTGFNGDILDRFRWQIYYTHSETSSQNLESNSGNVINLQNSLNAINVNGVIECADPVARAEGCVPANIFGPGKISAGAVNYIRATKSYNDDISEDDVLGDINGPIFHLPYGDVRLDLGFEHRREDGSSIPDALTASGLGLDTSGPATHGGYSVLDFFAEGVVPILKDLPFAKNLSIDAGYRHSDYSLSTVGGQESYKYGVSYAPVSDIRFRAEDSVAIRAPNINDLYSGRAQNAIAVTDPCSNKGLEGASNPGLRAANCAKFPGVVPGFIEQNFNQQSEISYQSGNPNLNAERALILTYGVVIQPRYIPKFSVSVDAFKYKIQNAIQAIDLQTAANQCADTLQEAFCQLVRRDPVTGLIQGVDSKVINVGAIREQGLDVALNYEVPVMSMARYAFKNVSERAAIDFSWNYEYIQYLNYITIPGVITEQTGLFGAPKNKWNFDALYRDDKFQLNYQLRYLGEQRYDPNFGPSVGNYFYSDFSLRYQMTPSITPYIGVNNLFNRKPPVIDQAYQQNGAGVATGVTGTETVPQVYDAIGRFIYVGLRVRL